MAGPAEFTVDTTADAVDADPSDGRCLTAAGSCSLRAAVMAANALPGSSITLPPGHHRRGRSPVYREVRCRSAARQA
ncbi:CSLREA domain-containing protein [Streptomyces sp. NPDC001920]